MNITTLKSELSGMLHGTTLNQITNLYGVFNRAARQILFDLDPQETKRIVEFTNPIYNQVWDYALPVDLKGNKIIDIRPQANRQYYDRWGQVYGQDFDLLKQNTLSSNFTIQFNTAAKTIRINAPQLPAPIVVNGADSVTGNGTWATGGDASNITTDNVNYAAGNGSIAFDLAAAGSAGYVENSTMTAVNLSDLVNQGCFFFWVYLPTASDFSSVNIRWGSSSTAYYTRTLTSTQSGTAFANGWNLMAANWAGSTVVGSPDASAIDYLRITLNYNGTAQTAARVDGVVCTLGQILECVYYSKYLFRDATTGAFQETVTSDTNLINLDTDTFNLYVIQCMLQANQQLLGQQTGFDENKFKQLYMDGLTKYKSMYKSEIQKPQTQYYRTPNPNFDQYLNGRWY